MTALKRVLALLLCCCVAVAQVSAAETIWVEVPNLCSNFTGAPAEFQMSCSIVPGNITDPGDGDSGKEKFALKFSLSRSDMLFLGFTGLSFALALVPLFGCMCALGFAQETVKAIWERY